MGYESRTPNTALLGARKQRHTRDQGNRDEEATKKISAFLTTLPAVSVSERSCNYTDCAKINLINADGVLTIQHRDKSFQVVSSNPKGAEASFREWAKNNMPHAKILPRIN